MKGNINRRSFLWLAGAAGVGMAAPNYSFGFGQKAISDLYPLLVDENGNRITRLGEWLNHRELIKSKWHRYLGTLPANTKPPKITVVTEDRPEGLVRQYITYEGEPGIQVPAYLLKPQNVKKPLPAVVAMHSTSDREMRFIAGVEQGKIVPFGYEFAKRGYAVICPMCFLMHDSEGMDGVAVTKRFQQRHPGSKGMAKMLFDAQRAVDVLETVPEVDKNRIGAMGHSLGAKEALYLGAFDDRVKAIVGNEGGIGIDFSNWDAVWYLGKDIHDFGHKHHEILALNAPKPFLLIGGDSADGKQSEPYIEAVRPVYRLYGRKAGPLELYNHGSGHGVHPEAEKRTYAWMDKYL